MEVSASPSREGMYLCQGSEPACRHCEVPSTKPTERSCLYWRSSAAPLHKDLSTMLPGEYALLSRAFSAGREEAHRSANEAGHEQDS